MSCLWLPWELVRKQNNLTLLLCFLLLILTLILMVMSTEGGALLVDVDDKWYNFDPNSSNSSIASLESILWRPLLKPSHALMSLREISCCGRRRRITTSSSSSSSDNTPLCTSSTVTYFLLIYKSKICCKSNPFLATYIVYSRCHINNAVDFWNGSSSIKYTQGGCGGKATKNWLYIRFQSDFLILIAAWNNVYWWIRVMFKVNYWIGLGVGLDFLLYTVPCVVVSWELLSIVPVPCRL